MSKNGLTATAAAPATIIANQELAHSTEMETLVVEQMTLSEPFLETMNEEHSYLNDGFWDVESLGLNNGATSGSSWLDDHHFNTIGLSSALDSEETSRRQSLLGAFAGSDAGTHMLQGSSYLTWYDI